jgi:hypothetical protein
MRGAMRTYKLLLTQMIQRFYINTIQIALTVRSMELLFPNTALKWFAFVIKRKSVFCEAGT